MTQLRRLFSTILFFTILSPAVRAEDPPINWIMDREQGFKKAGAEARPLFIYFAEVNKGARIIEMSVFDNPAVKAALKDFVCLRIDPFQHEDLGKLFGLTVAFAVGAMTVDNEVLAVSEGEFRAPEVIQAATDAMKKYGPIPSSGDLARLNSWLSRAESALKSKDYQRASREAKKITESKIRSGHSKRAKEILAEVDKAAAEALEEARQKEEAAPGKARTLYEKIKTDFGGSQTSEQATARLDALVKTGVVDYKSVEKAAYTAYRKGMKFERLNRYPEAIAGYKEVLALATTEYTGMAKAAIEKLESDPAVAKAIANAEEEKEAATLLAKANTLAANNNPEKAADIYRQIATEYPETAAATHAWEGLRNIRAQ
jgi:hypothetical protein